MRGWLGALLAVCLLSWFTSPALAESPMSTVTTRLPALATDRPILLGAIDGHPIAIEQGGKRAFVLGPRGWSVVDESRIDVPNLLAMVSDGRRTVLLGGTDGAARMLAALRYAGGGLAPRIMPVLPVPLRSATAAFEPDALLVAGLDTAGRPHLFRLDWTKQDVWQPLDA